jgi:hypothetical protein
LETVLEPVLEIRAHTLDESKKIRTNACKEIIRDFAKPSWLCEDYDLAFQERVQFVSSIKYANQIRAQWDDKWADFFFLFGNGGGRAQLLSELLRGLKAFMSWTGANVFFLLGQNKC